jgi:cyclophilin family peptidyl-prolyl cis-trans isomerase
VLRRLFSRNSIHLKTDPRLNVPRRRLALERLEDREVPSVALAPISQPTIPNNKPIFIPVNVTSTPAGAVTTTVSSDNSHVAATIVQGGQSVRFDVNGTDSTGVPFSGSITVRLFADAAPNAAQRIIDLANSGFFTGKNFPRILNNFMIQGGGTSTSDNSSLGSFPDQFNADFTFDSPGVLAMANSGDDTNNSQFFITDPKTLLATRHQDLDFNYTIVGILTDGFDTYQRIITTPVVDNGSGEVSSPTNPVTITGATVFTDTKNAVVELKPDSSFGTGTANIAVTSNDGTGPTNESFAVAGVNDGVNTPPFISTPIPNQTTTAGTPVSFTVPVKDLEGDPTTLAVKDTAFSTTTIPNATATINQTTGLVTITPTAGFTGQIQFKVGVRATSATDTAANYDTQLVTLTVNPANTPTAPVAATFTAVGSTPGTIPAVTVLNSDGTVRFTKPVFDPAFTGGVRVAVGDINGDGTKDVIAVPGDGGGGIILVLDSNTGNIFRTITIFADNFRGGLFVAAGDATGLGYDQVLVGAGNTGGPRVSLLDLKQNKLLRDFMAGNSASRGGVGGLAISDVFKNKGQDIIVGTGVGITPKVHVFLASSTVLVGSIPDTVGDNSGVRVRAGDQDATSGVRPIFIAPLFAPVGAAETRLDPSGFMNPDSPKGAGVTDTDSLFPL